MLQGGILFSHRNLIRENRVGRESVDAMACHLPPTGSGGSRRASLSRFHLPSQFHLLFSWPAPDTKPNLPKMSLFVSFHIKTTEIYLIYIILSPTRNRIRLYYSNPRKSPVRALGPPSGLRASVGYVSWRETPDVVHRYRGVCLTSRPCDDRGGNSKLGKDQEKAIGVVGRWLCLYMDSKVSAAFGPSTRGPVANLFFIIRDT